MIDNYYEILGVSQTATAEEIKKAYRQKARELHPDSNDNQGDEVRLVLVNKAYEILGNPQKRQRYNLQLLQFQIKLSYGVKSKDTREFTIRKNEYTGSQKIPGPPKFGTPEYEKWFEEKIEKYIERDFKASEAKVIELWHEIVFIGFTFMLYCLFTPFFNDRYTEVFFTFPTFMIYLLFIGFFHLAVMIINKKYSKHTV